MLIFHRFKSRESAERFAITVKNTFNLGATIHASQEESNQIDPFPFQLEPPIVLVERPLKEILSSEEALARFRREKPDPERELEAKVETFVTRFGGVYAGT